MVVGRCFDGGTRRRPVPLRSPTARRSPAPGREFLTQGLRVRRPPDQKAYGDWPWRTETTSRAPKKLARSWGRLGPFARPRKNSWPRTTRANPIGPRRPHWPRPAWQRILHRQGVAQARRWPLPSSGHLRSGLMDITAWFRRGLSATGRTHCAS